MPKYFRSGEYRSNMGGLGLPEQYVRIEFEERGFRWV